jgi:hypothetical protein
MPTKKRRPVQHKGKNVVVQKAETSITVENVNVPGYTTRVDATKYQAMRRAMLQVLPSKPPGLTQTEIREAVLAHLPDDLFPGGAKAGWWSKAVQLDLEAKDIVQRETTKPLRWYRSAGKREV